MGSERPDANNNDADQKNDKSKGIAGVMESNFGADKTTTSTFEKSQGEKFGANFDETGERLKGKFSVPENKAAGDAKASGSGRPGAGSARGREHATDGKQHNNPRTGESQANKGHETDTHKDGFGHKLKHRAEGRVFT